ncbi:hypothetical protein QAO71_16900 (plasmid) [Halopseudomonas sp. SMJS2]|uniref:hypothetical protein n=1 Tax=Halopseudomonas sp. SMJS2 TaxID=3041098 RepID=UPI002452D76B|nr:hypothetical protein [Halopseudomonas sp. SMJS2]WGK63449.1 hypothetical protein QAO71_16900 [Halopseudomonas sp. SMJS2]
MHSNMTHEQVLTLLKSAANPDERVLLDDGEFFVEHNVNCSLDSGNGFLSARSSGDCLGGYAQRVDGMWDADTAKCPCYSGDTDCTPLGPFESRDEAIAALWLSRLTAYSKI